ncbi:hypothetical protein [Frigoribacterium sp. PvP032]|uniref:hypothetical protein n=1 Tax=Frigoribacterium sp. PvP032 TaxID=2806589 RepID=UPI001AE95109|nr:hypothetical protein [Frigoribacterium sp. PvP032]MBP1189790.1 hypothetical protein [Frigoribacterium sp. PvP032]
MTEHERRRPLFVDDVTDPSVWEAAIERRALAASARRSFARRTADHLGEALGVAAAPRMLLDSADDEAQLPVL